MMSVCFKKGSSQTEVECLRNLNLLAHAQMEELEIGSRCGGYGECGGDRIRVESGMEFLSPITDAEREHLSAEEIAQGFRLACQSFPQKDGAEIRVSSEA
jgi:ferredoxin